MNKGFSLHSPLVLKNAGHASAVLASIVKQELFMHINRSSPSSLVLSLAAIALASGLSTSSMAQSDSPVRPSKGTVATAAVPGPRLTIPEVYERLDAAGYREQREIEWSDGRYKVKARNAQGDRVKLEVDGTTGAVLRSRLKH